MVTTPPPRFKFCVPPKAKFPLKAMAFAVLRVMALTVVLSMVPPVMVSVPVPNAELVPPLPALSRFSVPEDSETPPVKVLAPASVQVFVPATAREICPPPAVLLSMIAPETRLLPVLLPWNVSVLAAVAVVKATLKAALEKVRPPVPSFSMMRPTVLVTVLVPI